MAHPGAAVRGVQAHVAAVCDAINRKDGPRLASLLRVTTEEVEDRRSYRAASQLEIVAAGLQACQDPEQLVARVPEKLGGMVLLTMQAQRATHLGRHVEAFAALLQAANLFLPVFRNWEGTWAMPAMHVLVYDLRVCAERADAELAAAGKPADKLKGAGSFLMKVFGALAGKGPKKLGSLYVACQLFKIYFKLGTLNLSKSIIRVIDAGRGFEDFPTRDQVAYRYYTGRLEVFNDDFTEADQRLTFALERCHRAKHDNVRKLLKYLIPVRLSRGYLPSSALLQRFQLHEYEGIVMAMRRGDVRLLRDTLAQYEDRFLRAGVFLVLEKLELHVYRRLIKKIHVLLRVKDPARAHQVRMAAMLRALKWMGMPDIDPDEMACIVAVLIHRGFIKGYFSHKSKVLVLSKQQPFPSLVGRVM